MTMRTLTACGLIAAAPFLISEIAEAKECSRSGSYHLSSTGPWPMRIQARSGEACTAGFRAGGNMIFKRLLLVSAPQHGSISLREGGHYTYSTQAGYRGPDSFMLRICGNEGGRDGCADLQYTVTIE
jgi:hypothetical protein